MSSYREEYLDYPDGTKVLCRINKSENRPQVVLIHGLGEELSLYDFMFPYFDNADLSLNALELRGHGSCEKVLLRDFDESLTDLKRMIFGLLGKKPVYLIGVGAAGFVASRLVDDMRFKIRGLILVSPLDWNKISMWDKFRIRIGNIFAPGKTFKDKSRNLEKLCSEEDPRFFNSDECKKIFTEMPYKTLSALLKEEARFQQVLPFLKEIQVYALTGTKDPLGNRDLLQAYADKRQQSLIIDRLEIVKGGSHYLLLEKGRVDRVMSMIKWILECEAVKNEEQKGE